MGFETRSDLTGTQTLTMFSVAALTDEMHIRRDIISKDASEIKLNSVLCVCLKHRALRSRSGQEAGSGCITASHHTEGAEDWEWRGVRVATRG